MTRAVTVNFSKKVTQKSDPKGVGAQDMKLGVEGRGKWNFYCMPGTHGTHTYIHTNACICMHAHTGTYTHKWKYTHIPAHVYICTHIYTYPHTHTYIHTHMYMIAVLACSSYMSPYWVRAEGALGRKSYHLLYVRKEREHSSLYKVTQLMSHDRVWIYSKFGLDPNIPLMRSSRYL
jgi:hypothetical protein